MRHLQFVSEEIQRPPPSCTSATDQQGRGGTCTLIATWQKAGVWGLVHQDPESAASCIRFGGGRLVHTNGLMQTLASISLLALVCEKLERCTLNIFFFCYDSCEILRRFILGADYYQHLQPCN